MSTAMGTPRKIRRRVLFGLLAFGILAATCAVWLGVRGMLAKDELQSLAPLAQDASAAAAEGDLARIEAIGAEVGQRAERAESLTGDPIWRAAEVIPVLGANMRAARVVSSELAALSGALPDLVAAAQRLQERPDGTVVDVAALAAASTSLSRADAKVQHASRELNALDPARLIPPLSSGVTQLRDALEEVASSVTGIARAASVLPATLGAEGERTILVMIQNPAEPRSGGGITGTFAELHAENGVVSLVRQSSSADFPILDASIVDIPASTTVLYGDGVGRYVQNVTMTPDFAETGSMVSAWWERATGVAPDTVIAVDPYVLTALLQVTGPIDAPGAGTIDAGNAVQKLLLDPYTTLDPQQQDALFAGVTTEVFSRLQQGGFDLVAVARALEAPVTDGRISVWAADPEEAGVFAASALGGPRARQAAAGDGTFAVYVNDRTGGKIAPYLDLSYSATVVGCSADMADVVVRVRLHSSMPSEASGLPFSVTGGGLSGVAVGDIGVNVTVSGPAGSFAGAVTADDARYAAATAMDGDEAGSTAGVTLTPGAGSVLDFRFSVPRDSARQLDLVHTPLMNDAEVSIEGGCPSVVSP